MITELTVLVWGCVLALVHIFAAASVRTRQYGTQWNMGARDEVLPEPNPIVGRLSRAQANFFETFPIVIAATLMLAFSGRGGGNSVIGAWLWLGARTLYLPLYAAGIPKVRTLAFSISLVGIVMMLAPLFG